MLLERARIKCSLLASRVAAELFHLERAGRGFLEDVGLFLVGLILRVPERLWGSRTGVRARFAAQFLDSIDRMLWDLRQDGTTIERRIGRIQFGGRERTVEGCSSLVTGPSDP